MSESRYQLYSSTKEAWEGLFSAIQSAKKSIYWELYIFLDDEIGTKFFDVLEEKSRAGVDVKLIVDSLGSFWIPRKRVQSLKESGVDIHFFYDRTKRIRSWWKRIWHRTHRKVLIVDEQIGFIGGVNIDKNMEDWPDLQIRMEGQIVRTLLRFFAKSYIICGGHREKVARLLKYKYRVKHAADGVELVFDKAGSRRSKARQLYTNALLKARERVILFSPYYVPDRKFLYALWQARKRGVRVDFLIPFRSDLRIVTYAAYGFFSLMQRYGVHIHLSDKMIHGKGVVVDDEWAMIGSSNLEYTSFNDNYEANVKLSDKQLVKQLKEKISEWFRYTRPFDQEKWKKRSWLHRVKEVVAMWLYRLWHWRAKE